MSTDNAERAQRGNDALDGYLAAVYGTYTEDDRGNAIVDLIADLMHVAKAVGYDPDYVIERAAEYYAEETATDDTEDHDRL